jgi:F0F1-type ATP synthase assembly protein I
MVPDSQDSKDFGQAFALSQVGMEMVGPMLIGLALDSYLGWKPWATVIGGVLGFVGGLSHLIVLANRMNRSDQPRSRGGGAA